MIGASRSPAIDIGSMDALLACGFSAGTIHGVLCAEADWIMLASSGPGAGAPDRLDRVFLEAVGTNAMLFPDVARALATTCCSDSCCAEMACCSFSINACWDIFRSRMPYGSIPLLT